MDRQTTHATNNTLFSQSLYMAIELSNTQWKLGFTIGFGQAPRLRNLTARDLKGIVDEIQLAKERFGLSGNGGHQLLRRRAEQVLPAPLSGCERGSQLGSRFGEY